MLQNVHEKRHKGDVLLYQKAYKLATVLTFISKYGHEFHIHSEKIDEIKSDLSDFKLGFLSSCKSSNVAPM